jgi:sulfate adenylyltransferase (ADP) / ATP adenylyltransferase
VNDRREVVPGRLALRLEETARKALESGALEPIATRSSFVEGDGIRFLVRVLDGLARKRASDFEKRTSGVDPFLPYEQALFVAHVSETHVAILNKFSVLSHHLLVVTRRFEEQESLLDESDFRAMWAVMRELDPLFFYNAGPLAGASQRHKHLQAVPLPLDGGDVRLPMEDYLKSRHSRGLSFSLEFRDLRDCREMSVDDAARATEALYLEALSAIGRRGDPRAYNLLATTDWLVLVPRRRESWEGISVNSLAFAGAFLVKDEEELQHLRGVGPLRALSAVTE